MRKIKPLYLCLSLLLVLLTTSYTVAREQQTVGLFLNDTRAFNGYTLFAPTGSRTTYLIDNNGNLLHTWPSSYNPGMSAHFLENGNLLRTANMNNRNFNAGGRGGRVEEIDWNGNLVWYFQYSSTQHVSHHDIYKLPNGNVLMIAWEKKTYDEAISAGCKPNLVSSGELWPDQIIEVKAVGNSSGTIVWEWHLWDHMVQDYDASKPNYGVVAHHPELIDINYTRRASADWNHFNSIDYNEEFDQILISSRSTNEIYIIDHSTTTAQAAGHSGGAYGRGGDILYRWGNPAMYGAGASADQQLFGQHNANWIDDGLPGAGNILIFNNGSPIGSGSYSTVDEITPPADTNGNYTYTGGSAYLPASPTWTYKDSNPENFYADKVSGAQRLNNGNTLICSGTNGTFFEVTPYGEIVWKYINPVTNSGIVSQGSPIPEGQGGQTNQVFRCYRYAPGFQGFSGKSLTSQGPLVEGIEGGGSGGGGSGEQLPFGQMDSPLDNSTVSSSIAVTGWALDDVGVSSVKLYRDPVDGEFTSSVYVGDATFVRGGRPDVAAAYSSYPNAESAGWGYMLLTNFLPAQGNGTFTLHAIASDSSGNSITLGSKTIICDNRNAVKPFGAIDTPQQGGIASGSQYIVWGWALTPLPNFIALDGSTIDVWVDGVMVGHPSYNIYRADIAGLFPSYSNSNGAIGYFILDTTKYGNGIHTIQWTVRDNAGNSDGIGSRYFTINN